MNNVTQKEIFDYILHLLEKKKPIPKDEDIGQLNYYTSGHVDSMGMMKFIVEIEDKYNIELSDEDIVKDGFKTIQGVVDLVWKKVLMTL
jgi:acyl carrier protein